MANEIVADMANPGGAFVQRATDPVVTNVATPVDFSAQFPTPLDPTEILTLCEDVDLSTLALKYGYELIPLNNPGLHHMSGIMPASQKGKDTQLCSTYSNSPIQTINRLLSNPKWATIICQYMNTKRWFTYWHQ